MCAAILSIVSAVAGARPGDPVKGVNAMASSVIDAFVDAHKHGDAQLFNLILSQGAMLKMNRGDEVITHTKNELISFYKKSGNIDLNCSSDYEVLSASNCVVVARVDFKFPEFVQQHFVTVEKDKKGVWRITQLNRFTG